MRGRMGLIIVLAVVLGLTFTPSWGVMLRRPLTAPLLAPPLEVHRGASPADPALQGLNVTPTPPLLTQEDIQLLLSPEWKTSRDYNWRYDSETDWVFYVKSGNDESTSRPSMDSSTTPKASTRGAGGGRSNMQANPGGSRSPRREQSSHLLRRNSVFHPPLGSGRLGSGRNNIPLLPGSEY